MPLYFNLDYKHHCTFNAFYFCIWLDVWFQHIKAKLTQIYPHNHWLIC